MTPRPKNIYLTEKGAEKLAACSDGVETTRVKRYPSKHDIEYTDLSQVWHTPEDTPRHLEDCLIYDDNIYVVGNYNREAEAYYANDGSGQLTNVESWAYISDLTGEYL